MGSRQGTPQPQKHRLSFEEAATAFEDGRSLTLSDPAHSVGEERFVLLGRTSHGLVVVVAFTQPGEDIDTVRIISARLADRGERHDYEEG